MVERLKQHRADMPLCPVMRRHGLLDKMSFEFFGGPLNEENDTKRGIDCKTWGASYSTWRKSSGSAVRVREGQVLLLSKETFAELSKQAWGSLASQQLSAPLLWVAVFRPSVGNPDVTDQRCTNVSPIEVVRQYVIATREPLKIRNHQLGAKSLVLARPTQFSARRRNLYTTPLHMIYPRRGSYLRFAR